MEVSFIIQKSISLIEFRAMGIVLTLTSVFGLGLQDEA